MNIGNKLINSIGHPHSIEDYSENEERINKKAKVEVEVSLPKVMDCFDIKSLNQVFLSFLDHQSILSLHCTNKNISDIARKYFFLVASKSYKNIQKTVEIMTSQEYTNSPNYKLKFKKDMSFLFNNLSTPKMKKYTLCETGGGSSDIQSQFFYHLNNISENTLFDFLLQTPENLTYLNFSECKKIDEKFFFLIGQRFKNLKILNLYANKNTTADNLSYLPKGIEALDLRFCSDIEDKELKVLEQLTELKELYLTRCNKITDVGLKSLSKLTNLEELALYNCNNHITDKGIMHLQSLENLKYFSFTAPSFGGITDQSIEFLKKSKDTLTVLRINSGGITDKGLEQIKEFKNLERLCLIDNLTISDEGIDHLTELPKLELLNLDGCMNPPYSSITRKKVDELRKVIKEVSFVDNDSGRCTIS